MGLGRLGGVGAARVSPGSLSPHVVTCATTSTLHCTGLPDQQFSAQISKFAIFGATNCTGRHFVTPFYNVAYFRIGITQTSFAHIIDWKILSFP